jgi:dipeptidyl aminopeptidase/acylaminoacyl peptidase
MLKTLGTLLLGGILLSLQTAPPPDTDIFLAPLTRDVQALNVGTPVNITNTPGYDNQPSFTPDGTAVLFTSARGGAPEGKTAPQMDIYRYDIATKRTTQVTKTAESEYSATVMPDGKHISVIRVEADESQRLWKFPLSGGDPSVVLTDIKPVGYHAWLDANTLALFILGQPATLQIADVRSGRAEIAARDIGRSLQPIPAGGVSFVQRAGEGPQRTMTIAQVVMERGKAVTRALTAAAPGATDEFVAWMPDGGLLMAARGQLYAWRRGDTEWKSVADLAALGLRNVSRLAVSPKGDRIAFVAAK